MRLRGIEGQHGAGAGDSAGVEVGGGSERRLKEKLTPVAWAGRIAGKRVLG